MTNPSNLVITGLDGYFILNFLQKSGYMISIQMSRKKLKKFQILKEMEEKPVSVYRSREKEKEMRKKVEK